MPVSRLALLLAAGLTFSAARGERVTISLLATTDLHGNIYPFDYYTGKPAHRGLAKIATLIHEVRSQNPNTVLIDCGDTIQGTPLEYVYQTFVATGHFPLNLAPSREPLAGDPMMLAMNRLRYDAMVVGNHEFNYGLANLAKARAAARFPWIAANIQPSADSSQKPFEPYVVKNVAGVKIAIIGLTTPAVPNWEKPENFAAYRFLPAVPVAREWVARLRSEQHPDLIIVAAHSGLGRDLASGAVQNPGEDVIYDVATQVPGIDAIVFGHSHQQLAGRRIGNVLVVQPKNWGASLAKLDFVLDRSEGGPATVVSKESCLEAVSEHTAADPEILKLARPYHEIAERYLNTPVAHCSRRLEGTLGRVQDTALADTIQRAQLYYAKADVSFTALFNPRLIIPPGEVTVRQIAGLYVYDNQLYAIEGNGRMVKDALENAARYFLSCRGAECLAARLLNPRVMGFNFDMAEGVEYEIDLTRPQGDRISNLRWRGKPLEAGQKLRIAVNNYRAAGSAGYSMFARAPIVWRSTEDIRDLLIRYYTERGELPSEPDGNWRVIPPEALQALERQAMEDAKRAHLF